MPHGCREAAERRRGWRGSHCPGSGRMTTPPMAETIPIRPGEELDVARVEAYLREHVPDVPAGPLRIEQFPSGASNLTYLLRVGGWEGVLRRPPLGPLPPKAHDMVREAR